MRQLPLVKNQIIIFLKKGGSTCYFYCITIFKIGDTILSEKQIKFGKKKGPVTPPLFTLVYALICLL